MDLEWLFNFPMGILIGALGMFFCMIGVPRRQRRDNR